MFECLNLHFFSDTTSPLLLQNPTTTLVPKKLTPIQSYISTLHQCHLGTQKCFDGKSSTMCLSQNEDTPWLSFEFQSQINVSSIVLQNPPKHGNRTANVYVRVTNRLPAIEEGMFSEGNLIGSYIGPGRDNQTLRIEADSSLSGRYLLIQMDKRAANRSLRYLNLNEVEVIGTLQGGDISKLSLWF